MPALIAAAKDKPASISIGSGGNGSLTHLMAELFMLNTDVKLVHIPYKARRPPSTTWPAARSR